MGSFLKRLLLGRQEITITGDVATGDWSPIPVSATAQAPNIVGWLQEEVPSIRGPARPVRMRRDTIRRMVKKLAGATASEEPRKTPLDLTAAEDHTAPNPPQLDEGADPKRDLSTSKNRPTSTASAHSPSPVLENQVPLNQNPKTKTEDTSTRTGEDTSLSRAPSSQTEWSRLIQQYGEQMTEEELKILLRQMG